MLRTKRFRKKLLVHLQLLPLLAIMAVGTFTFANNLFFFTASATYIEGLITQDTIWTLTDSPFVVSKKITVCPGATLTIEPGVEVRFGGDFSLIVEGSLSVIGAKNDTVTFTSNKDQPEAGDWDTIKFNGTEPSTLVYCVVQYAKNGITIENGNVKIENSEISTNSQNGITIVDSTAEVKNNEIANNRESGICVTGDNQVTIQNNTISSNKNAILLTGDSTTGVHITENIVMSNTQSGIQLDADDCSNIVILNNILSANNKGFYVSGQANTYITKNSISYNTIGIFYSGVQDYKEPQDHEAHWNDIYENEMGIDVSSNPNITLAVHAEYNYWGDESGPYHTSLNPTGKGNPVGGDGVNLDFIFFLTAPIGYINERPTARLLTDKKVVSPNQIVTFIATTSSDDRQVDQYCYDFGDGHNSGWTTLSIFVHEYSSTGTFNATLKVMDDFGVISDNIVTVRINCQALTPLDDSLTLGSFVVGSGEQVSIIVHAASGTSPIENANITLFSIIGGIFEPSSGLTNSTGDFTATFSAPNVTQITNVRITATVSKADYADGSDYKYLMVLPPLLVEVTTHPDRIKSEAISNVAVHVTYSGAPVSDATIVMSSDGRGSFDREIGTTNENGDCVFIFTAPHTARHLNVTITATASKSGYIDGEGQTKIAIEQALLVQVVANPVSINSEVTSNVTVHVTYELNPIPNAMVAVSSDKGGSFISVHGTTNANGECVFTFTSPKVTTPTNITISATATRTDYANGKNQTTITVSPGRLSAQVVANPSTVESEATSTVTVHVTCNTKPVTDAVVTVSSEAGGTFSFTIGTTNINGDCTFAFTAPHTTTHLDLTITATASKSGYIDGQGQTKIIVNPAPPGLPLTIIFMVAAVAIVISIVLVLIKLRIILISLKEV